MPERITGSATWANTAAAGTQVVVDAGTIEQHHGSRTATVLVHNPSTVTAITVAPRVRVTDGTGTVRSATLGGETFTVPAASTHAHRVEGIVGLMDLALTNDTALGLADGFTAQVVVQWG